MAKVTITVRLDGDDIQELGHWMDLREEHGAAPGLGNAVRSLIRSWKCVARYRYDEDAKEDGRAH